jgi:o-succinylbenzoate---CoA ligase
VSRDWGVSAAPGELVAVEMPPGPRWLEALERLWGEGTAVFPLDTRLAEPERRRLLELAGPTWLVREASADVFPGRPVDPGIAAMVATSGSEGAPRLAELSREALEAALTGSTDALGISESVPWVSCLTPAHIGGLLVLLRGVVTGAPVVVHERFEPARVAATASGGAWVSVVPTMVKRLVEQTTDLTGLHLLVGGGELRPGLAAGARELGASVVSTYGLTESCGGVVYDGSPVGSAEFRLDGADRRIELRGPTLMEGYRADPAGTGAAFTVEGWLRTGDSGRVHDDGRLTVEGRLDDLIRTGAEKVWPAEVEAALEAHPKVREVAVAGRPHPEWGEQVVAFVVPRSLDDPPSLEDIRNWTFERIAPFKAPRELVLIAELPRTPGGKLRRSALQGRPT